MMVILRKALRAMAKDKIKRGRSARNGNAPSPYNKYNKTPYKYSSAYHSWRADRLAGRVRSSVPDDKFKDKPYEVNYRYKEAAE